MDKINAPTTNDRSALDSINITDNSTTAQRSRLLSYLKETGYCTTNKARDELNILHPAGRIKELRDKGYNIVTHRSPDPDHAGRTHNVGLYVLLHSKQGGRDE